jgi:xanthine dehydrogenase small subunit
MQILFELNGEAVCVDCTDPHLSLLHWLRARGLTGTKEGCAEGECGACAVAVLCKDSLGLTRYVPVNSCLLPLAECSNQSLLTVESLAQAGTLHPVQQAMVEHAGSQCGYCTPGFVMSLFCEYYRPERQGFDPESISGNLCRCTGYRPIALAAKSLGTPEPADPFLIQLSRKGSQQIPELPPSLGAPGTQNDPGAAGPGNGSRFSHPASLEQLFAVQEQQPDAVLLAGGTDLMVPVNQRNLRYPGVIFLDRILELKCLDFGTEEVVIGAGLSLSEIERRFAEQREPLPLLQALLPLFSSRLVRNRATLGGNLGTASPIGDSAPVLLALDAELSLVSKAGVRRVKLCDFFRGYRKTALAAGELIQSVHFPKPFAGIQRFYKVSKRELDDISTVAGAFALDLDAEHRVTRLRMAYGGIAATPVRALVAEQLAQGKPWNQGTLGLLLSALQSVGTPLDDHRGSARYRRAMISKLLERFFVESSTPVAPTLLLATSGQRP